MTTPRLSAREMQPDDIAAIADYWTRAPVELLEGMGVDPAKLPSRNEFVAALAAQLRKPVSERQSFGTIWEADGEPVGHCNVNRIAFGAEAYMHLHLWQPARRHRGLGPALIRCSLPYFFERLELEDLYCEPYARNAAPNGALPKAGFEFVQEYVTVPGAINFVQPVRRWHLSRIRWQESGGAGAR